ncbi:DUF6114 domain-containing protein [Spirillospora sp. CA-253888]
MSASDSARRDGTDARTAFARWRRRRPLGAGLLIILGGAELALVPLAPLGLVVHQGIAGVAGYVVGLVLVAVGCSVLFQPLLNGFFGVVAILLGLTSLVTSNLGGFLLGALLALAGGIWCFAWTTRPRSRRPDGHSGLLVLPLLGTALPGAMAESGPSPADAAQPRGTAVAAVDPNVLKAAAITGRGVRFEGVRVVPTATGPRRVLRLRMSSAELRGVHQSVLSGGNRLTVQAPRLDLRGVVMETTFITGKALGVVPLPLSAELPLPPIPLTLPILYLTDISADGVYVRASTASAPGLRLAVAPASGRAAPPVRRRLRDDRRPALRPTLRPSEPRSPTPGPLPPSAPEEPVARPDPVEGPSGDTTGCRFAAADLAFAQSLLRVAGDAAHQGRWLSAASRDPEQRARFDRFAREAQTATRQASRWLAEAGQHSALAPTSPTGRPPALPGPVLEGLYAHLAADYRRQIATAVHRQLAQGGCREMKEGGRRLLSRSEP